MSRIIDKINDRMDFDISTDEYEAIFGKTVYTENIPITQSSDYNCGAISNEMEYVRKFLEDLIDSFSIENAEDNILEIVLDVFLNIERIWDESDENLKKRFFAYMVRNNNERWDTTWSIIDIFSYFFPVEDMYLEENYIETDLILNGGFESATGHDFDSWTESVSGSSTITKDSTESFVDENCVKFSIDSSNSQAYISQTVSSVAAGDYKICFFKKDDGLCPVDETARIYVQRSGDSYYYDFDTNAWQSGIAYKDFDGTSDWGYCWAFLENEDTRDLTIFLENSGGSGTAYSFKADRFMFGEWEEYPSIKLIIGFEIAPTAVYIAMSSSGINLINYGECEDATYSPMLDNWDQPTGSNFTWARDAAQFFWGSYSYKYTKTIAAGTYSFIALVEDDVDDSLYGLTPGSEYSFSVRVYIPSASGILGSEIKIKIRDYESSWAETEQACANTYDAWQFVTVTRTIRSSATGAHVRIETDSAAALNEYFYVDDVRMKDGAASNLSYASFIDNSYITGAGGGYTPDFYLDIINKAKASGVKATIETVSRVTI